MTDFTHQREHGRLPSEEQMDSLLRDFFRLETPSELARPLDVRRGVRVSLAEVSRPKLPSSVRFRKSIVASALAVVVFLAIFNVRHRPSKSPFTEAQGISQASDLPGTDAEMPVSPGSDRSTGTVGADGVTLQETDNVEIHPHRP